MAEIEEVKTGKPFPAWKFIPWVLDALGHELMKKPPPPELTEEEIEAMEPEAKDKLMKERGKKEAEEKKVAKEKEVA